MDSGLESRSWGPGSTLGSLVVGLAMCTGHEGPSEVKVYRAGQDPGIMSAAGNRSLDYWSRPGTGTGLVLGSTVTSGAQAPQWESSLSELGCLDLGRVGVACETVLPALFTVPCLISALHPGAGHSPGILSYYKGIFLFG